MASITIDFSDEQLQKLRALARAQSVEPETLLKSTLGDWLDSQTSEFVDAADYVLKKNAELYKRLA